MSILRYHKTFAESPKVAYVDGVAVRQIVVPADDVAWLALRERAFESERPPVGRWTVADFQREFTAQTWWSPERMWLATPVENPQSLIGSITLSERGQGRLPALHWLLVDPAWRRRGVGRLLLAQLEAVVWQAGGREIVLETHSGWEVASEFYRAAGFISSPTPDP